MRLFSLFQAHRRRQRPQRQKGQTLVEYSLILAVITIVSLGVFTQLGQVIVTVFSGINVVLDTATTSH